MRKTPQSDTTKPRLRNSPIEKTITITLLPISECPSEKTQVLTAWTCRSRPSWSTDLGTDPHRGNGCT